MALKSRLVQVQAVEDVLPEMFTSQDFVDRDVMTYEDVRVK